MIPTLTTKRLVLRAPRLDDLGAYAAFCASPRSALLGGPFPRDKSFTRLSAVIGHWTLRGFGRFMVADQATDAPLGVVGPFFPEGWPEPEIAWSVFDQAEGRGIAHEAAQACLTYAYDTLGWATAVSLIAPDNARSAALARRLGATQDGTFATASYGVLDVWRHAPPRGAVQ